MQQVWTHGSSSSMQWLTAEQHRRMRCWFQTWGRCRAGSCSSWAAGCSSAPAPAARSSPGRPPHAAWLSLSRLP